MTATHDTTTAEATTKHTRPIDIYAAPDCDIDLLSEVPRVTVGLNGKSHLVMLPLMHEGEIGEAVEDTAMLSRSDLMLVRTRTHAYLMRTSDYEANLPKRTSEEIDRADVRSQAADLINGMITGIDDPKLDPTASMLWDAGALLMQKGINSPFERLGILMMLDALVSSPEAAQKAILVLHEQNAAAYPELPR